jgi:hypothetical protein
MFSKVLYIEPKPETLNPIYMFSKVLYIETSYRVHLGSARTRAELADDDPAKSQQFDPFFGSLSFSVPKGPKNWGLRPFLRRASVVDLFSPAVGLFSSHAGPPTVSSKQASSSLL